MTEHPDFDDEMFADLLGDFLDESAQLLEILSQRLIELDEILKSSGVDYLSAHDHIDIVNEVFRAAHSIKGASGMLGMANINSITHKMENQLDEIRSGKRHLSVPMIELLFTCINRLESLCAQVRIDGDGRMTEREHTFITWLETEAERCDLVLTEHAGVVADEAGAVAISVPPNDVRESTKSRDLTTAPPPTPKPETHAADSQPAQAGLSVSSNAEVNTTDNSFDMQKYLQLYLDECEEEIEALNNALLALESDPFSRDSIHEVFRMAHRIKGSSAAMGFDAVTRLTHEIESIFDDLRSGTRSLDDAILNVLFRCIDGLRDYHLALRAGNHDAIDLATLHAQLIEPPAVDSAATGTAPVHSAADMPVSGDLETEGSAEQGLDEESWAESSREPDSAKQAAAINANEACSDTEGSISIVAITFDPGLSFVDLKAEVIQAKLRTHAEILAVDPPIEELPGKNEVAFRLVTTAALTVLGRLADIDGVIRIVLEQRDSSGECVDRVVMENGSVCLATNTLAPPLAESDEESHQAFSPPSPDKVAGEALRQPASAAKTPAREVHAESEALPAVAAKSTVAVEPAGKAASNGAKTAAPAESTGKVAETVRVEIDRLDHLMNLAGELVINKARFVQIANGMQSIFHGKSAQFAARDISDRLGGISKLLADAREQGNGLADVELLLSQFSRLQDDFGTVQETLVRVQEGRQQFTSMAEAIHQLTRVSDGIQKSVMETRMVPVGPLFIRFKRVIRDIARGAGKEVNLVIGGEKTELDKRMIDELGDPLIHMVRNAVDHGLETPQERAAVGKSRSGTIRLDANHRGNSVVITVSDDGRGIDVQRLRQKLVEKNILSEADALQLPDKQVLQYIWFPGFSTAAKITDISGRGVGMDIVKSKIEELNGTVDVKTEVGVGTTFSIRLPLTLAILPSLLARICGEVYAMPLEAVEEIVKVPVNEIYTIQGKEAIRVRNRVLSLARLDEIFSWPSGALAQRNGDSPGREETVVIVEANDIQVGLVVDSLLGEDDIVIKSLAHNFVNVRGLAGASILGDGRVSLILDVGVLIDMVSQAALRDGAQAARPGRGPQG